MKTLILAALTIVTCNAVMAQDRVEEIHRFTPEKGYPAGTITPLVLDNGNIVASNEYGSSWLLDSNGQPLKLLRGQPQAFLSGYHTDSFGQDRFALYDVIGNFHFFDLNGDPVFTYQRKSGGYNSTPLVLPNGNIAILSQRDNNTGIFLLLSPQGQEITKIELKNQAYGTPVITTDGKLVFADKNGTLHRFDPEQGSMQTIKEDKREFAKIEFSAPHSIVVSDWNGGRIYNENGLPGHSFEYPKETLGGNWVSGVWKQDLLWVGLMRDKLVFLNQKMEEVQAPEEIGSVRNENNSLSVTKTKNRGMVIVVNNSLHFFSRTRDYVSNCILPRSIYGGPVFLSDGTVVVGTSNGVVYFVNPESGKIRGLFDGEGVTPSPILVTRDDTVLVGSSAGVLHFLKLVRN